MNVGRGTTILVIVVWDYRATGVKEFRKRAEGLNMCQVNRNLVER